MSDRQAGRALPLEYEFTEEENQVVTDLTSKMAFVGLASAIIGVLLIIIGGLEFMGWASSRRSTAAELVSVAATGLQGIVLLLVGVWTRSASEAFKRIVDTEGNDIGNLMFALGHLRRIYGLQRAVLIVALALLAVGVLVIIAAMMS